MQKNKKDDVKKLQEEIKQETSDEILASEEGNLVSVKKVIYAEIDDEITTLYEKIKNIKADQIYIVIPKRAMIFQSIVNLKILKRKAYDSRKTIFFVTNDQNGIYLAQQVGITVYDKINNEGKALFSTDINDEKLRIMPLKATVNSLEENAPTRMSEKKISISEILRKSKVSRILDISKIGKNKEKNAIKKPKLVLIAPNRQALIGIVVFSIFILLTIVYIALPGATIYLTPAFSVLEKSVNITLADYQRNQSELNAKAPHFIASFPIETSVKKTLVHYATGKKFSERGANSSGKLTIVNTTNTSWPLAPKTRFQTEDGLVFRISNSITVPSASAASGPGKIEAFVTADPVDSYGEVIGERGNIGPSKFMLPGLKEDSRSKLYAESSANMTGGITDFISFITPEDINAAKERLKQELIKDAVTKLKSDIKEKEKLEEKTNTYMLLEGDNSIKIGEVKIQNVDSIVGQEVKQFQVVGEVFTSGVYYNRNDMLEILKSELLLKKSPQKDLVRINEDSTSYRIFEWDTAAGKIKLTANIKGIEQYSIDENKENGKRLLTKIKQHIVGKEIEEAKIYIQNLPEVNKVDIESWPVWAPTIPKLTDNIEFKMRDANLL
ncbi:MAG: hypothetical protein WC806_02250 [Candidatus Gracilibacteria bacterium]|jgi:hypothetical protein